MATPPWIPQFARVSQGPFASSSTREQGGDVFFPIEYWDTFLAWAEAVRNRGARAGVYCSGIDVPEGGSRINTAENIQMLEAEKSKLAKMPAPRSALWVANDQCPPASGCTSTQLPPSNGSRD